MDRTNLDIGTLARLFMLAVCRCIRWFASVTYTHVDAPFQ